MSVSVVTAARDIKKPGMIKRLKSSKAKEIIIAVGTNPSKQRNLGVAGAKGNIIYFLDDDSSPDKGNIQRALAIFKKYKKAAVVGGPDLTPADDSFLGKSFGAVFASVFASGKSSSRYKKTGSIRLSGEKELILCNMFIKKSVFTAEGGFRHDIYPNEENEFLSRIAKKGHKIIYDPDISIKRKRRRNYFRFIKQCFTYGKGRADQSLAIFVPGDIVNFVPAIFFLYVVSLYFVCSSVLYAIPALLYLVLSAAFSVIAAVKAKNILFAVIMPLNFFTLHFMYGAGIIWGLIRKPFCRRAAQDGKIRIKKVKP